MAGIYIHIPFCKQACYYCDFHFSSYLALKEDLVDAMVKEIFLQTKYLSEPIDTIYFGGGTPSLLNDEELEKIFTALYKTFQISSNPEITLEANPDDLNSSKLAMLKSIGVNRLSIGIQTFNDALLKFLNRLHSSQQAIKAYHEARLLGFDNISCDLIYAIPGQSQEILANDLETLVRLSPDHISAYCLTIEERTVFGNWSRKNKFKQVDEEIAVSHTETVWQYLTHHLYEQYEISNFCQNEKYSRHNSSYWKDVSYLGIGPGAHSYNGKMRQYNISNNNLYIKSISKGENPTTLMDLSVVDSINEYILTSLRTKWGCNLDHLSDKFNFKLPDQLKRKINKFEKEGLLIAITSSIILTEKGKLLADFIASELFVESI